MKVGTQLLVLASSGVCAVATHDTPMSVMKPMVASTPWNFLVMGDWGGDPHAPYTTSEEVETAAGMGKVSADMHSQYALALGDNFYTTGVKDVADTRFHDTFENVFTAATLQGDDYFRVLLGNHDHYGNASAQIAYSNVSARWRMDDNYWSFSETLPGGVVVDTVFLDTVIWAGKDHTIDEAGVIHSVDGDELPGPSDQAAADAQFAWVEAQLEKSTADYLLVAGHYPVYSICEHGSTTALKNLIPLLEKYNVAAYFNGHDHCQQYIDDGKGVQYHTIGSAHSNDASTAHNGTVPEGSIKFHVGTDDGLTGGFGQVTISDEGLTVHHYCGNGTLVYSAPTLKPRKKKGKQ